MAEDKTIIELAPVLHLPPVDTEQMQPHALDRYLGFLKELYSEVPLDQLSDEDLTHDERAKGKQYTDKIAEWVHNCDKDGDEAALRVYPYSTVIIDYMSDLKALLKSTYERKARKQKRLQALEAIKPPFDDAKKYLTDGEYQGFLDSLPGAADAYLDSEGRRSYIPDAWLLNRKASDYMFLTYAIKDRAKKEARQKQARREHDQFIKEINGSVKKIKQELAKVKKPNFAYPPALAKYKPNEWSELELPTEGRVKQWAEPYVWKRVPPALKPFASWSLDWQVQLLPYAKYELLGVPCLTWCFRVVVLVKVHLRLMEKAFVKEFRGWEYKMKVEPEELGYFHLGPVEWDDQEAFSSPIPLLCMLAEGKLEDDGIEVFKHDGSSISFCVSGYDEGTTEIDEQFRQFVMDVTTDKTLAQGLLATGMIDEITAQLVEDKAKLPLPQLVGPQASAGGGTLDNSDVKAALQAMGYKAAEIKEMMKAVELSPGMTLEEKIKAVLKNTGA